MGKSKLNIPMCAALMLLLLTMLSIHMTSGLYARYTAKSLGSDNARVAKFDVTAEVQPDENKEGKFTVLVTNESEVAVKYNIVVEFTAPMSVSINDGEPQIPAENESLVSFTDTSWILEPGSESPSHILQFAMTDWTYITKNTDGDDKSTVSGEIEFAVRIIAEQVE